MTQVNEVNMAKWIVALRSGKYQQAREKLRDYGGAMCCLGVLCDISGLGEWEYRPTGIFYAPEDGEALDEVPPIDVAAWVFPEKPERERMRTNPMLLDPTTQEPIDCAEANDDRGWGFGQIANALESRYLPGKKAEEILEAVTA